MSEVRPLIIPVGMDKKEFESGQRAVVDGIRQMGEESKRGADVQAQESKRAGSVTREAAREAKAAIDAEGKSVENVASQTRMATRDMVEFGAKAGAGFEIARRGADLLLGSLRAVGQAYDAARRAQQDFAGKYASLEESAAEIANISGKTLDRDFIRGIADFGKTTGMTAQEIVGFTGGVLNSGQQWIGKNISESEFEEYKVYLAKLGLNRKLAPEAVGEFGGSALAFTDFDQFGDKAAEEAAGRVAQALSIASQGSGNNTRLAGDIVKLAMQTLNEDKSLGVFQDLNAPAAIISTIAQSNPQEAEVYARAALRGLRDFDGDPKTLFAKAGIDPQTDTIAALRQLAPVVQAEAQSRGVKELDVLKTYFKDDRTAIGVGTLLSQGIRSGVIDSRLDSIKDMTPQQRIASEIAGYESTPRFRERRSQADLAAAELGRGEEDRDFVIARREAAARLIEEHKLKTTGSELLKGLAGLALLPDTDEEAIDKEVFDQLRRMEEATGVYTGTFRGGAPLEDILSSPEKKRAAFNRSAAILRAEDIDPSGRPETALADRERRLRDAAGGDEVPGPMNRMFQERQLEAQERAARAAEKQAGRTMTIPTAGGGRAQIAR